MCRRDDSDRSSSGNHHHNNTDLQREGAEPSREELLPDRIGSAA